MEGGREGAAESSDVWKVDKTNNMIDNSEQHSASQQVIIIFLHAQKIFNIMIFPSILAGFYRSIKSR